ncbi:LuxR family transcriptional regulator [Actinomadura sp. ATCC 31491]|uniref:LuxR family transcriptional regulator n=1 Tax=Actinomadura luzonensis TaxID=2805427 RepID=A0ABT0FUI9_9ACTN|nr:AAA family ATPase [Actinomadura luzonensis]MCK2215838.1 LuxR family transcriptional regulator [Actinomadura luzonensis]
MTSRLFADGFVGRRHELSVARRMLHTSRLLTLTGAGGVGKTRLALKIAETLRPAFQDVEVVELGGLAAGEPLEAAVARALGVDPGGGEPARALADHLSGRRTLLVLDDCEHVRDACARLVDLLLRAAPRLRVLATSRQTLGVYGEQVLTVPALPVPEPGQTLRETARLDAVRLFVERAATVRPGFTLNPDNVACVTRLVRRLEGVPLAIELAAARLRTAPLEELARRLEERPGAPADVLAADVPAALPRHRTLRATLDWSFGLCSEPERRLWARLSAFPGDIGLEAAEAVGAGGGIEEPEVVDLLAGLVDKSVLAGEPRDDGMRYHMLESLRAYGAERLEPADRGRVLARYVHHHRDLVERHRIDRAVPDQLERFRLLRAELPNVRAALEAGLARGPLHEVELGTASALWCFWLLSGEPAEGRRWLERGLALAPEDGVARATALWADGMLALRQGDLAGAGPRLAECLELARRAGNESVLPHAIRAAGVEACTAGDPPRGMELLREALGRFRAADDVDGVLCTLQFAAVYGSVADPEQAAGFGEELLELCERHHAVVSRAYAQLALGVARWCLGDCPGAEGLVRAAAEFTGGIGDRWGLTQCLEVLAWAQGARGRHEVAAGLLGAASSLWRGAGVAPERLCYHAAAHERCAEEARRALGPRAFSGAFHSGARLGPERAMGYAASVG